MASSPVSWHALLNDPLLREAYERNLKALDGEIGSFLSFALPPIGAPSSASPRPAPLQPASPPSTSPQSPDMDTAPDTPDSPAGIHAALAGIPFAVKDNIAVKNRPLTCASKILEGFIAPYTATAVSRLEAAGARVVGKTNLDEFGMGSSSENSALGTTVNPWDTARVPGGSSGGSAAAVAAGLVPLALGSDTGGSVRQPANFCGVYGLKPTYGAVSRRGLTAYASSLEVIGFLSRDIDLLEAAFKAAAGPDEHDQSSLAAESLPAPASAAPAAPFSVAVLDVDESALEPAVAHACSRAAEALKQFGCPVSRVRLPSMNLVIPAYYTIAAAEASANLARYNGIRYGNAPDFAENPAELMRKARHAGFGNEVKLRILLGTYVLRSGFQDQYYLRAQKIRTLIRRELQGIFARHDLILMPVFPTQAFPRSSADMDDYRRRISDIFTCLANLAGLPALALPVGAEGGLPAGIQLMAPAFGETRLIETARRFAGQFPIEEPPVFLNIQELS